MNKKLGIVCSSKPTFIVIRKEGVEYTNEQIVKIAEKANCEPEQIKLVTQEEFAVYAAKNQFMEAAAVKSINEIKMPEINIYEDFDNTHKRTKIRKVTKTDEAHYVNKIIKRRKKNKNIKTHRR